MRPRGQSVPPQAQLHEGRPELAIRNINEAYDYLSKLAWDGVLSQERNDHLRRYVFGSDVWVDWYEGCASSLAHYRRRQWGEHVRSNSTIAYAVARLRVGERDGHPTAQPLQGLTFAEHDSRSCTTAVRALCLVMEVDSEVFPGSIVREQRVGAGIVVELATNFDQAELMVLLAPDELQGWRAPSTGSRPAGCFPMGTLRSTFLIAGAEHHVEGKSRSPPRRRAPQGDPRARS